MEWECDIPFGSIQDEYQTSGELGSSSSQGNGTDVIDSQSKSTGTTTLPQIIQNTSNARSYNNSITIHNAFNVTTEQHRAPVSSYNTLDHKPVIIVSVVALFLLFTCVVICISRYRIQRQAKFKDTAVNVDIMQPEDSESVSSNDYATVDDTSPHHYDEIDTQRNSISDVEIPQGAIMEHSVVELVAECADPGSGVAPVYMNFGNDPPDIRDNIIHVVDNLESIAQGIYVDNAETMYVTRL